MDELERKIQRHDEDQAAAEAAEPTPEEDLAKRAQDAEADDRA